MRELLKIGLFFLIVASLVLPGACGKSKEPVQEKKEVTGAEMKEEVGEAVGAVKAYTAEQKQEIQADIEGKLKEFDEKIEQLANKAQSLEGEAKEKLNKEVEALKEKQGQVAMKIDELKASTEETWNSAMEEAENALKELGDSYEQAQMHMKP